MVAYDNSVAEYSSLEGVAFIAKCLSPRGLPSYRAYYDPTTPADGINGRAILEGIFIGPSESVSFTASLRRPPSDYQPIDCGLDTRAVIIWWWRIIHYFTAPHSIDPVMRYSLNAALRRCVLVVPFR
jgi:hypothetical protein